MVIGMGDFKKQKGGIFITAVRLSLMMIGLVIDYGVGPIELLNKKQTYHLMGECH